MLQKMVFGPRSRLSPDLDFTSRTPIDRDGIPVMMLDALAEPYNGIVFRFDKDKDWYLTSDGCAANPVCSHAGNEKGVKIKLQVSTHELPILGVEAMPQVQQDYFKLLPYHPASISCLAFEEVIAEKIRAASQRSKIRDLLDLSEVSARPLQRDLIRALAVLKLWNSGGRGLDFKRLRRRIQDDSSYDIADLRNLLRKDQNPVLNDMIVRVVEGFHFLADLTERREPWRWTRCNAVARKRANFSSRWVKDAVVSERADTVRDCSLWGHDCRQQRKDFEG